MAAQERSIAVPGGRTLRILEDGDSDGRPIFVLHGTPGSRLLYGKHVAHAARRGIRLIGFDRPGYGGSTPTPGRRMIDAAEDVRAIADAMGFDQFAVWGHSGGGAPALACAARLKGRIVAASCLASPAPFDAEGLDQFEGMGELNVVETQQMLNDRPAWEKGLREQAEMMKNGTVDDMKEYLATLLSEVDRGALTSQGAQFYLAQGKEALRPGVDGWRDDCLWGVEPWGFELSAIEVPHQLWHGKVDKFVPFTHGEWLAAHLPEADIHLESSEGHISLFENRIPEVQEWLLARF